MGMLPVVGSDMGMRKKWRKNKKNKKKEDGSRKEKMSQWMWRKNQVKIQIEWTQKMRKNNMPKISVRMGLRQILGSTLLYQFKFCTHSPPS